MLITVMSENRPPRFPSPIADITVQENSLTGTAVYDFQATAEGATEGESGDIVYSMASDNSGSWFHVDQLTGQLFVVRDLDYEQHHSHTVTLLAEHRGDASLSDVMTLTVHVTNVNDNSPTFLSGYRWSVPEGSYTDTSVGTVEARDGDEGPFGEVRVHSGLQLNSSQGQAIVCQLK